MPRCYLAGWKTVTAPNQYDYLLGDVVPIGYGSNGSAELKNNFTLISLSIVSTAHLVSEEFWSHWLIMERFNAVWMVNRNTEEPRAKLNRNQNLDVFDKWKHYSAAEWEKSVCFRFSSPKMNLKSSLYKVLILNRSLQDKHFSSSCSGSVHGMRVKSVKCVFYSCFVTNTEN